MHSSTNDRPKRSAYEQSGQLTQSGTKHRELIRGSIEDEGQHDRDRPQNNCSSILPQYGEKLLITIESVRIVIDEISPVFKAAINITVQF